MMSDAYLYSHPRGGIACNGIVGAFFKQDAQVREISLDQVLYLEIRVRLKRPNPVDQFPGGGFFFNAPEFPHPIKGPEPYFPAGLC